MLITKRLLLRRWRLQDRDAFAAMNDDPKVMFYMPRRMTRQESDRWMEAIEEEFQRDGFGIWALELPDQVPFIGFAGLRWVSYDAHFTPAVEIGWRLSSAYWGQGFATEAAREAARVGFSDFKLGEIVAETAETNLPSRRVMDRVGMQHDTAGNFLHPAYSPESDFVRRVLYRLLPEQLHYTSNVL